MRIFTSFMNNTNLKVSYIHRNLADEKSSEVDIKTCWNIFYSVRTLKNIFSSVLTLTQTVLMGMLLDEV